MNKTLTLCAWTSVLALSSAEFALAQQDADRPIDPSVFADPQQEGASEAELPAQFEVGAFPGYLGSMQGQSGSTSRFDPQFNPAMGIILDGFVVFADAGDASREDDYNQISLRAVEFDFASRIDPLGWAYVVAEFGNEGGGEYAFELLEAAVWFDQLPNRFSVRAGRYYSDFGKWNTIHIHDRPIMFEEGARQEFFGGSLISNGLELHQWNDWGGVPVRWSLGIASGFEGHSHSVLAFDGGEEDGDGHEHAHGFASESSGSRGLGQFAFTGRLTAQHDLGDNSFFQWGVSAFVTDAGLLEEHDDGGMEEVFELGQSTFAVDLLYRSVDGSANTSQSVGVEFFLNERDVFDEDTELVSKGEAVGLSAFVEQGFSSRWSVGAQASWWEHADKEDGGDWFTGEDAGRQIALYTTWQLSHYQRIRLSLANFDPTPQVDADWIVALQWVGIIGSHSHALDW
jgi:hypothetical protein